MKKIIQSSSFWCNLPDPTWQIAPKHLTNGSEHEPRNHKFETWCSDLFLITLFLDI
nr:MAG TPA: hypothetical protein [Caudoviricetes sp.]